MISYHYYNAMNDVMRSGLPCPRRYPRALLAFLAPRGGEEPAVPAVPTLAQAATAAPASTGPAAVTPTPGSLPESSPAPAGEPSNNPKPDAGNGNGKDK